MNPIKEASKEIFWVLKAIKRQLGLQTHEITLDLKDLTSKDPNSPPIRDVVDVIVKLEREWKVLKIIEKHSESEKYGFEFDWRNATRFVLEVNTEKFGKFCNEVATLQKHNDESKSSHKLSKEFLITVRDREIWINNYLIAKPHAVGSNYDFFEYILSQPANKIIKRKDLSDDLKVDLGNKTFFKILNALGFKSEIKRAFFYKVDAITLGLAVLLPLGSVVAKNADIAKKPSNNNQPAKVLSVSNNSTPKPTEEAASTTPTPQPSEISNNTNGSVSPTPTTTPTSSANNTGGSETTPSQTIEPSTSEFTASLSVLAYSTETLIVQKQK